MKVINRFNTTLLVQSRNVASCAKRKCHSNPVAAVRWECAKSPFYGGGDRQRPAVRSVPKSGKVNRDSLSDWAVWSVVEQSSKQIGIEHFGAHDLRRTCAKLCHKNGGDLEPIKFPLGHSSIQTTERYLGSEQDIEIAVNDNVGL
jgi:integrase